MITYEQIAEILKGIDKTEQDTLDGWWETSSGAALGTLKLLEIKALFDAEEAKSLGKCDNQV